MSSSSTKERTTLYDAITGGIDCEYQIHRAILVGSSGKIHARSFAAWLEATPPVILASDENAVTHQANRAAVANSEACGFVLNLALDGLVTVEFALWAVSLLTRPNLAHWQEWGDVSHIVTDEDKGQYAGMAVERAYLTAGVSPIFDRFYTMEEAYRAWCKGRSEARELFGGVL